MTGVEVNSDHFTRQNRLRLARLWNNPIASSGNKLIHDRRGEPLLKSVFGCLVVENRNCDGINVRRNCSCLAREPVTTTWRKRPEEPNKGRSTKYEVRMSKYEVRQVAFWMVSPQLQIALVNYRSLGMALQFRPTELVSTSLHFARSNIRQTTTLTSFPGT